MLHASEAKKDLQRVIDEATIALSILNDGSADDTTLDHELQALAPFQHPQESMQGLVYHVDRHFTQEPLLVIAQLLLQLPM